MWLPYLLVATLCPYSCVAACGMMQLYVIKETTVLRSSMKLLRVYIGPASRFHEVRINFSPPNLWSLLSEHQTLGGHRT